MTRKSKVKVTPPRNTQIAPIRIRMPRRSTFVNWFTRARGLLLLLLLLEYGVFDLKVPGFFVIMICFKKQKPRLPKTLHKPQR